MHNDEAMFGTAGKPFHQRHMSDNEDDLLDLDDDDEDSNKDIDE